MAVRNAEKEKLGERGPYDVKMNLVLDEKY